MKNQSSHEVLETLCRKCAKTFPVKLPEGPTKFATQTVTCPHCNDTQFFEVTTDFNPKG